MLVGYRGPSKISRLNRLLRPVAYCLECAKAHPEAAQPIDDSEPEPVPCDDCGATIIE